MNRDNIKYLSAAAMLLNHIANIFLIRGTWLCEILITAGYFTAVTMCYFLAEGYSYTRSRKNYACRLTAFALLSQIPYSMAFAKEGICEFRSFSMMTTLLLSFGIIWVQDAVTDEKRKIIITIALLFFSTVCDWAVLAPAFTLLIRRSGDSVREKRRSFAKAAVLYGIMNFISCLGPLGFRIALSDTIGGMLMIGLSCLVLTRFYNGKQMEKGRCFSKWFFYLFYPIHLLVLAVIRIYG